MTRRGRALTETQSVEMQQAAKQDADACFAEAVGPGGIARATAAMLTVAGRPVRRLSVAAAYARAVGVLMMHFMLEIVMAPHLLGVDPYDQPAAERGKGLVRRYLEAEP